MNRPGPGKLSGGKGKQIATKLLSNAAAPESGGLDENGVVKYEKPGFVKNFLTFGDAQAQYDAANVSQLNTLGSEQRRMRNQMDMDERTRHLDEVDKAKELAFTGRNLESANTGLPYQQPNYVMSPSAADVERAKYQGLVDQRTGQNVTNTKNMLMSDTFARSPEAYRKSIEAEWGAQPSMRQTEDLNRRQGEQSLRFAAEDQPLAVAAKTLANTGTAQGNRIRNPAALASDLVSQNPAAINELVEGTRSGYRAPSQLESRQLDEDNSFASDFRRNSAQGPGGSLMFGPDFNKQFGVMQPTGEHYTPASIALIDGKAVPVPAQYKPPGIRVENVVGNVSQGLTSPAAAPLSQSLMTPSVSPAYLQRGGQVPGVNPTIPPVITPVRPPVPVQPAAIPQRQATGLLPMLGRMFMDSVNETKNNATEQLGNVSQSLTGPTAQAITRPFAYMGEKLYNPSGVPGLYSDPVNEQDRGDNVPYNQSQLMDMIMKRLRLGTPTNQPTQ